MSAEPPPVPVLAFHHLDADLDDYTNVRPELYSELLTALAERCRFTTASDGLSRRGSGALRPIVLTFDDAYASIARPVLRGVARVGAVGTICAITGYVGRANEWNRKCAYWRQHLDVPALRDLRDAGWELASHTREHHNLTRLPADHLRAELCDSRRYLEDTFGARVSTVAYPYGRHDERVRAEAARHYDYGLTTTTKPGSVDVAAHPHQVRRLVVTRSMSVADILTGIDGLWGYP